MVSRLYAGAGAVALLLTMAGEAVAQSGYPAKPVRMIVPSSPGGGIDIIARMVGPRLTERLGQQIVIENRPGAGNIIGTEMVVRSPADGYTLLAASAPLTINPAIYRKMPYDGIRDLAPITQAGAFPNVLVVHPSLPARSVKELIALARARPGQISYGSAGNGTNPHFAMALFLDMAKIDMLHIPYKGSAPAIVDLVAGHVQVMGATILTGLPHARSGRLRLLGVTSSRRVAKMPEVPTVAEAGVPGYEVIQWYGFLAPAQVPKDIVARLHTEIARIVHLPEIRDRLAEDGGEPVGNTPEEFARFIRADTDKWARVARDAGIKPEQ